MMDLTQVKKITLRDICALQVIKNKCKVTISYNVSFLTKTFLEACHKKKGSIFIMPFAWYRTKTKTKSLHLSVFVQRADNFIP